MQLTMESLLMMCDDGACCCIPHRCTVGIISFISLLATVLDGMTVDNISCGYYVQTQPSKTLGQVNSLRSLLVTLFQLANLLLLLASIAESAVLVQVYIWYTLGFVVMQLVVTILEFLYKFKIHSRSSLIEFVVETSFLFVVCRCLPLVDTYRKHLENKSIITSM